MNELAGTTFTVQVAAPADAVWAVLTERRHLRAWMNGADVRSTWESGAPISIVEG